MSYLDRVRLHFAGEFRADVSTVNNDATHYDSANFSEDFQKPPNGSWQPAGTGAWRLVNCRVTRACYDDGTSANDPATDPVISMKVTEGDGRVSAKLVDLDPMQQLVSTIYGLQVRIVSLDGTTLLTGEFQAAPFYDIFWTTRGRQRGWRGLGLLSIPIAKLAVGGYNAVQVLATTQGQIA